MTKEVLSPVKSLNVLHTECSLNWGGQEYRTCIETRWLNDHGHKGWIACDPRSALYYRGAKLGVPVVSIEMRRPYNINSMLQLAKFCRHNRIDLINNHGSRDSSLCFPLFLAGYATVRSRHITDPVKSSFNRSFSYRFGCSRVIATAAVIREMLIENNRVKPKKIDVVGEGVDLAVYNPSEDGFAFRREFDIPEDTPLVGIIGMMRPDKGHPYFLDAAFEILKSHPGARFALIGEGVGNRREEYKLRARVEEAGESRRVIMTGYRWDIPEIIAALDIVVVASTGVEAQSRVVPQAFASKRAVVATDVGGISELLRHEHNGLLVPPANPQALAAAIRLLIDAATLREHLAAKGYETAQADLSLERMMELTLNSYRKAIHSSQRRAG